MQVLLIQLYVGSMILHAISQSNKFVYIPLPSRGSTQEPFTQLKDSGTKQSLLLTHKVKDENIPVPSPGSIQVPLIQS